MFPAIEERQAEVVVICRRHGVERLDLFGPAAGERGFDPARSDLDFVVSFKQRKPSDLFGRYFGLKEDLEALFDRRVDLIMEGALRKDATFAEGVRERRVSLYAA